jgi:hypothetical protein
MTRNQWPQLPNSLAGASGQMPSNVSVSTTILLATSSTTILLANTKTGATAVYLATWFGSHATARAPSPLPLVLLRQLVLQFMWGLWLFLLWLLIVITPPRTRMALPSNNRRLRDRPKTMTMTTMPCHVRNKDRKSDRASHDHARFINSSTLWLCLFYSSEQHI